MYFTTLYEKYDTTGQMKDIRLPVEKKEKMESCALSAIMVIVPSRGECVEKF